MERKPKRRTRERILQTALALFNTHGEPNVTTQLIADELDISPGNLYYHFRSKDDIIESLFADFEREMTGTLAVPVQRLPNVEDLWLFLHLVFEGISKHRFLYRDLNDLLSRNRLIESHFQHLLQHKIRAVTTLCTGLVAAGDMQASSEQIRALALNMTALATYWLSFEFVRTPRRPLDNVATGRGAYQVMVLIAPYLQGRARLLFEKLSQEYLPD